jgi:hypothetical protein
MLPPIVGCSAFLYARAEMRSVIAFRVTQSQNITEMSPAGLDDLARQLGRSKQLLQWADSGMYLPVVSVCGNPDLKTNTGGGGAVDAQKKIDNQETYGFRNEDNASGCSKTDVCIFGGPMTGHFAKLVIP